MVLASAVPAAAPALGLADALRAARPAPERLAVESALAAAAREISLSRGVLLDAAAIRVEAGPRRTPSGEDSDLALDLDLPLAADAAERRAAVEAHGRAARDLLAAADLEATLALRLAFLEAWEAGEALALAERDAAAAESWLAATEARVAAGADAPYEAALVASEVELGRLARAAAREPGQGAWSALPARADVAERPTALREPVSDNTAAQTSLERSALARAIESRAALQRALLALDAARAESRWSLGAALAREGDEDVARLGLGFRIPLAGQGAVRSAARAAALAESARSEEIELERLAGRLAGALERRRGLRTAKPLLPSDVESALAALDARLGSGKDRPSQVLPLRRQLVNALGTALAARAALLRAAFEIEALTTETPR
jgi:hypothetical protein